MNFTVFDLIGLAGVALIVGVYLLSQMGRMNVNRPAYPAVNGVGAVLILISLLHTFNLASFVIEIVWLAISIAGLVRALRLNRKG